ncbi:hypothetical protein CGZ93_03800 [Enemella dayhoffiae]|uniref:Uncharacterized protein n=1 Tax=Enemella dayhoffiae TaxID=2016507 RepID=A0A255H9L2_9ACTN|nr:hypothetical protein [Enemella dayhoffiae]OYO24518.1 hypothetical protein CGZ93_03800 [Enemella dayhoffiae]
MSESADPSWHVALAYALTGQELPLPRHAAPEPEVLVRELAELGWGGEVLRQTARSAHPVPDRLRNGLGAAQFWSALSEVRRLLGATGATAQVSSGRTPNAEERRLLADRPPHHG